VQTLYNFEKLYEMDQLIVVEISEYIVESLPNDVEDHFITYKKYMGIPWPEDYLTPEVLDKPLLWWWVMTGDIEE